MNLPIEDTFSDIVGKAQRGWGREVPGIDKLLTGLWEPETARVACRELKLDYASLEALAHQRWRPDPVNLPEGLALFTTPFGDMTVNAYLVWDVVSGEAAAFDTGADATPLLEKLEIGNLKLKTLFLTHTHGDHVLEVDRLVERTGCRVLTPRLEPLAGAEPFDPGMSFKVGRLDMESCPTPGHSPGGTSYAVHGLRSPVMIVGDALFAGSVGGIKADYEGTLRRIREQILNRQENTLLCPGHGPLTTVGEEKRHNPFFAGGANV